MTSWQENAKLEENHLAFFSALFLAASEVSDAFVSVATLEVRTGTMQAANIAANTVKRTGAEASQLSVSV
eukprot:m.56523 g.56523  ORF g.56523 m.56523 type:complete len:70 (+) comp13019_c0_seq3:98-307(+)